MIDIEPKEGSDFLQVDLLCKVCFAEFLDWEDLEVHIRHIHLNESNRNRFCTLCTNIFGDIKEYAMHLRDVHLSSLKCCKYCTRLFETTLQVQDHEKKHNAASLYPKISCSQCKNILDGKVNVKNHEMKEHSDSDDGILLNSCLPELSSLLCMNVHDFFTAKYSDIPYVCVKCLKSTTDAKLYIQHLIDNEKCQAYACNECCKVYPIKRKLNEHLATHVHENKHGNEANVPCPKCNRSVEAILLQPHVKKCTGMHCEPCDLYFSTIEEYNTHSLSEHKRKLPSFQVCIYCQCQKLGVDQMKKHIDKVHASDKHLYKYQCKDCDKFFKHPQKLFGHFFSTHKDLHPYTCVICNKKFRIRKNFTLHIKLTHKSIGFVEFNEDFHVFFTDKKPNKPSNPQSQLENADIEDDVENQDENLIETKTNPVQELNKTEFDNKLKPDIDVKSTDQKKNESHSTKGEKENKNQNVKNNNEMTTDCELVERPVRKSVLKRKRNATKKKIQLTNDTDVSSDDSDVPLKHFSKKLKRQKNSIRKLFRPAPEKKPAITKKFFRTNKSSKKFVCSSCNKNCYTYQNFQRHKAMHIKNETKLCIKCFATFDSVKKLNKHIETEHSSSKLTETLKKLIEKRKIEETKAKEAAKAEEVAKSTEIQLSDDEIIPNKERPLSTKEKFQNTIKKFNPDRNITTKVTMNKVDKDHSSVKKYIENFVPDNNEVKVTVLKDPLKQKRPLIKMAKFTPDPIQVAEVKLKMPVKFTNNLKDKYEVNIKLVTDYQTPTMSFYKENDNNVANYSDHETYDNDNNYDTYEVELETKDDEIKIPEVAQEVMLEGTEEQSSVLHTVNLKNIPHLMKIKNIQIAHLSPHAPYFKISKIKVENDNFSLKRERKAKKPTEEIIAENITLPNGKKLVNVNPFEHLLNKKTLEELKINKNHYKPKISNVAEAIKSALVKLEKSPVTKGKKKAENTS